MGFKITSSWRRDAFGNLTNQCWDGLGPNPSGIPRCNSGAGGSSPDWSPPIGTSQIATDQNKLQGRQEWEYKLQLLDMGQGFDKWFDPPNVKEMYYEEDCFSAFGRGYFILDAWHEGIDREPKDSKVPSWTFRNDGRDEIRVGLRPI